jgi:hypothetical protein
MNGSLSHRCVDVVWIMESSEHFRDKRMFFECCARRR